jgi:large subunit ribosomal protein L29
MKTSELRTKSMDELRQELKELLRAQFNLRMQLATQQTNKTHEIRRVRRDIARVRTIMTQAKIAAGN